MKGLTCKYLFGSFHLGQFYPSGNVCQSSQVLLIIHYNKTINTIYLEYKAIIKIFLSFALECSHSEVTLLREHSSTLESLKFKNLVILLIILISREDTRVYQQGESQSKLEVSRMNEEIQGGCDCS